jgi:hypothetical protein
MSVETAKNPMGVRNFAPLRPYMSLGWGILFASLSLLACTGLPEPYYCHSVFEIQLMFDAFS